MISKCDQTALSNNAEPSHHHIKHMEEPLNPPRNWTTLTYCTLMAPSPLLATVNKAKSSPFSAQSRHKKCFLVTSYVSMPSSSLVCLFTPQQAQPCSHHPIVTFLLQFSGSANGFSSPLFTFEWQKSFHCWGEAGEGSSASSKSTSRLTVL